MLYVGNCVYIYWGSRPLSVCYIVCNSPGRIGSSSFLLNLQTIHTQYHYLHTDIKNHHLWLINHSLSLFDVSFHYPENVGKYKIIFQNRLILGLNQSGENIRHCVRCCNPLILSVGAHGGCHGHCY